MNETCWNCVVGVSLCPPFWSEKQNTGLRSPVRCAGAYFLLTTFLPRSAKPIPRGVFVYGCKCDSYDPSDSTMYCVQAFVCCRRRNYPSGWWRAPCICLFLGTKPLVPRSFCFDNHHFIAVVLCWIFRCALYCAVSASQVRPWRLPRPKFLNTDSTLHVSVCPAARTIEAEKQTDGHTLPPPPTDKPPPPLRVLLPSICPRLP